MFRYRRYRLFLVFSVVTILAIYKFGRFNTSWQDAAQSAAAFKNGVQDTLHLDSRPRPPLAHETKLLELNIPAATSALVIQTPPPLSRPPLTRPPVRLSVPSSAVAEDQLGFRRSSVLGAQPNFGPKSIPTPSTESSSIEQIHWTKLPEQFPVPASSLIHLPTGKPKPMPKIQAKFEPEDEETRKDRLEKLAIIKKTFKKSWDGYRKYAWLHDELRPMSGNWKDPFAGWGATLVDALDTLWIMGMKEEFEEAVRALNKIDFTTTTRADIPVFETTIRYLGGLLAAYDVSGNVHKILLAKAIELAEILISAFDTPNRMPDLYYYWRPQFASQRHRAKNRVVLAEIGSLSMEFTRLAQLTGEHKYYDAIARITDLFEEFQSNTTLPGMWPTNLDASGCGRRLDDISAQKPLVPPGRAGGLSDPRATLAPSPTESLSPNGEKFIPLKLPDPIVLSPNGLNPTYVPDKDDILGWDGKPLKPSSDGGDDGKIPEHASSRPQKSETERGAVRNWDGKPLERRQLDVDDQQAPAVSIVPHRTSFRPDLSIPATPPLDPDCVPQGFAKASGYGREEYTLGGMSDSTYEYLSKQYILLGGQVEKYRTMYEKSMDAVKKHLIYRPMLPREDNVLFCGKLFVPSIADDRKLGDLDAENAHLTCFAGGMFGMGAKLFDRPEDLEIAKKLTEGCIVSYNMTKTGIMPEAFEALSCEDQKACTWNQTRYYEALDPSEDFRQQQYEGQLKLYNQQLASASVWYEEAMAAFTAPPTSFPTATQPQSHPAEPTDLYPETLNKRQLDADMAVNDDLAASPSAIPPTRLSQDTGPPQPPNPAANGPPDALRASNILASPTPPRFPLLYSPVPPLDQKTFVKEKLMNDRLPIGVVSVRSRNYILRPEAIESIFYMHRITASPHWREAGWTMFQAIMQHTTAKYGNSAIDDVTLEKPNLTDDMESFWLAETLKYFYLLFEEEDVVSLDEWVLNTEAHPFKRPA